MPTGEIDFTAFRTSKFINVSRGEDPEPNEGEVGEEQCPVYLSTTKGGLRFATESPTLLYFYHLWGDEVACFDLG